MNFSIKRTGKNWYNLFYTFIQKDKTKVFGIGKNKTGTTSLKAAMKELGFIVGNQRTAELLFNNWGEKDFKRIARYCRTAQFFQDVPFSLPDTYISMDKEFPGSKFILTIRDSPEQWYNSITRFHAKLWGKNGRIPTAEDLQKAIYIFKGRPWIVNQAVYKTPPEDPYNKKILIDSYVKHNYEVLEYFKNRPNDLLVLNVAENDAFQKLARFLNKDVSNKNFPWKNKTIEI